MNSRVSSTAVGYMFSTVSSTAVIYMFSTIINIMYLQYN